MLMSRIVGSLLRRGINSVAAFNRHVKRDCSTVEQTSERIAERNVAENAASAHKLQPATNPLDEDISLEIRFRYPEFLPDPNVLHRNGVREKLERIDMLARRVKIGIPEFYVGSILSVTYSEPHAPSKVNRFVGICIQKSGCGLRACFTLRNVVADEAVEILYDLYDPAIQKIDCLRLEKRLDEDLYYLRDAPLEYSTVPFDIEPQTLPEGAPVPINDIVVPLNPKPWLMKYEQKDYKGLTGIHVSARRQKKMKLSAKPWEKWDLMKIYRETIPEEEQRDIYMELKSSIRDIETTRRFLKRKREFVRPVKKA